MKTETYTKIVDSRIEQLKIEIAILDARILENIQIRRELMAPKITHDVVDLMRF